MRGKILLVSWTTWVWTIQKKDIAVPSYLKCGRPEEDSVCDDQPRWAELTFTFADFWEFQSHWLAENPGAVQILDMRKATEFN